MFVNKNKFMKDVLLRQDNRITMARYELSLIEKRVLYFILKEIRKQFVLSDSGQRDLFDDLIVTIDSLKLTKDVYPEQPERVKQALKSLRSRSFEYDNGEPEDSYEHHWFEVGFINWAQWSNGGEIKVQISKMILPFYVELTSQYTEYSLIVVMSLKSKWSQRMYELCAQWRAAGGFQITVAELREMFKLEKQYSMYASFKKYVLEVGHKEIKKLYDAGQCDLYFEYSEKKIGRAIGSLRFKIITNKDIVELSLEDIDYHVRTSLNSIFNTDRFPKNAVFVGKTMTTARFEPELLKHLYDKIIYIMGKHDSKDIHAPYLRTIINEDILKLED